MKKRKRKGRKERRGKKRKTIREEKEELQKTLEVGWAPGGGWLGLEGGASSLNTRFCLPKVYPWPGLPPKG